MSHDRDAFVVFFEPGKRAIEFRGFLVESRDIAEQRGFEPIENEVVIAIEPGIFEQNLRLPPGVDVVPNEAVNENDYVLRLKKPVTQMQKPAFVMRLLAKPSFILQAKPAQGRLIGDQRTVRKIVVIVRDPSGGNSLHRPESDEHDKDDNDVAISPAKA